MKRKYAKPAFEKSALVLQAATATGSPPRPMEKPVDLGGSSLNGTGSMEHNLGGGQQDTAT
jgi:hypothetical protein